MILPVCHSRRNFKTPVPDYSITCESYLHSVQDRLFIRTSGGFMRLLRNGIIDPENYENISRHSENVILVVYHRVYTNLP